MPFAYMLRCADGSYYVGSTRDLDTRMEQHHSGAGSAYTSRRMPVELVFAEEFDDIGSAFRREKQIQGWSRRKREALITGDYAALPGLSATSRRGRLAEE
ncbi:GIY-YIG nuclease family protein [Humibacter antri]